MSQQPLVSVVIPSYNCARYILQAVESALDQSYPSVEIVVVDDGSTDETAELLERYRDRIRYIHQANRGLAGARNAGIRNARGDFVAFLDSDDVWFREKLEQQVAALLANPRAGLVHTDCLYRNEQSGTYYTLDRPRHELADNCYRRLFFGNCIHVSTAVVPRKCLEKVGLFEEAPPMRGVEDYDLWLRLARHYEFAYVPRQLAVYRHHGTNMSLNGLLMKGGELAVVLKALDADPDLGLAVGAKQLGQRLSELRAGVGYLHFKAGNRIEARRNLYLALRYRPRRRDTCLLWAATLLPSPLLQLARSFRQALLQLRL
jgi:glycosyltransferase involved in cell wall biosynthesis